MNETIVAKKSLKEKALKINEKAFAFLCKSGKKDELVNIIVLTILLLISGLIYCLYLYRVINLDDGVLLFDFLPILPLTLLVFPGTLLLAGLYFLVNYSGEYKNNNSNGYIIFGSILILMSFIMHMYLPLDLPVIIEKNDTTYMYLPYSNIVSMISTILVFIFVFGIKKVPYFSARQLILLFISNIIIVGIIVIIIAIIIIIIGICFLGGLLSALGVESSSSSSYSKNSAMFKIMMLTS